MKIGDLVYGVYDAARGIECLGLVLDTDERSVPASFKILWSSKSAPTGWWYEDQLEVAHESKSRR